MKRKVMSAGDGGRRPSREQGEMVFTMLLLSAWLKVESPWKEWAGGSAESV